MLYFNKQTIFSTYFASRDVESRFKLGGEEGGTSFLGHFGIRKG